MQICLTTRIVFLPAVSAVARARVSQRLTESQTMAKIHSSTHHESDLLPHCNADGLPVIPMDEELKYRFDVKGWVLLPELLSEEQLVTIRAHQLAFLYDRESLPPEQRDNHVRTAQDSGTNFELHLCLLLSSVVACNDQGGPSQVLLDHPRVVGVLNEILSHQGLASEECYGFRFDHTYTSHRIAGHDNWRPHGGSGFFNFPGSSHMYHMQQGKVHAGLTRVVWELNEVKPGDGATKFISGSHKAAFSRPPSADMRDCDLWEDYSCPAGSCVIFTEALTHTGDTWTNEHADRLSLFTCYDTVNSKWGKDTTDPAVVLSLPPLRQTLFRGVWAEGSNKFYDAANRSSIWAPTPRITTQDAAVAKGLTIGAAGTAKADLEEVARKAEALARKKQAEAKLAAAARHQGKL